MLNAASVPTSNVDEQAHLAYRSACHAVVLAFPSRFFRNSEFDSFRSGAVIAGAARIAGSTLPESAKNFGYTAYHIPPAGSSERSGWCARGASLSGRRSRNHR
jgi:hypothetical protein